LSSKLLPIACLPTSFAEFAGCCLDYLEDWGVVKKIVKKEEDK